MLTPILPVCKRPGAAHSHMASTRLVRRIMASPRDLTTLVSDVEKYPEFINLISALRVSKHTKISETQEQFEADATVAYKFVRESFRSLVKVDHAKNTIAVSKADHGGAVKTLQNDWHFHGLSDGSTLVDFSIDVSLKAYPLEILLREKFDRAGEKMMTLFENKAARDCPKVGAPDLDVMAECKRLGLSNPT